MANSLRSTTKNALRSSRHARPATSYVEPPSDIDEELYYAAMASDSDESGDPPTVKRSQHRTRNPTTSYAEPPSDIDGEPFRAAIAPYSNASDEIPTTQRSPRRARNHKTSGNKRSRQESPPPAKKSHSSPMSLEKTKKRRVTRRVIIGSPAKHPKSSVVKGSNISSKVISKTSLKIPSEIDHDPYSSGIVPPWSTLPYLVLLEIFRYASYPLHDGFFRSLPSADWLLKTSRVCRAFSEPALTVLYHSPPLVPMERAHRLRQLLMADQAPMSFKYRAKVECLEFEVSQTVAYTLQKWGSLDLYGILYNCPRLTSLELYHQKDLSPYKHLDDTIKWTYPEALFEALSYNSEGVATKLQSWRWNSRLAGKRWPVEKIPQIHLSQSFNSLRKVAFVNYQELRVRKNEEAPQHQKIIGESLSILPNLQHLILESSPIVDATFLPLLPKNLRHLEIINCWRIEAEHMSNFLLDHGNSLESLTLDHNQSLSLSFLTILKDACPRLKILKMNLTYYNVHTSYHDSEPLYGELLGSGEVPKWPSSLEIIELTQLRKWDVEIAKSFFQSLLGSARSLLNLRRVVIKAIINTSWRERSTFRDTWVGAFERVFKRPFGPPNPNLRSLGAFENSKKQKVDLAGKDSEEKDTPSRRSQRMRMFDDTDRVLNQRDETASRRSTRRRTRLTSNSPTLSPSKLKSKSRTLNLQSRESSQSSRRRALARELEVLQVTAGFDVPNAEAWTSESSREPETPTDGDFVEGSDDEPLFPSVRKTRKPVELVDQVSDEEFIQGMCDFVLVRIDNLRPAETQFREADFLDSEPDGDSEWDGDYGVVERYAW